MSGGSRVTKTETSPWGVMPGAEGDTFEFGGQTYPSSMISPGGAFPQGLGQLPGLTKAFEAASKLYAGGQYAPSYFPSRTYAGFDPAQQAAQTATLGYAGGGTPDILSRAAREGLTGGIDYGLGRMQRGEDLAQPLSQTQYSGLTPFDDDQYGGLLSGDVNYSAGRFGEMAKAYREQAEGQMEKALENVREKQVLYQPGGGSRGDIFAAQATEAGQKALNQNLAALYGGAYQQAQAARLPAAQMGLGAQQFGMGLGPEGAAATQGFLGQYPSVMGAPLGMAGAVGDVGAQRRAMTQAGIDEQMARHQYEATLQPNALQNYLAAISGEWGGTATSTAPGQSPVGSILGALAGGAIGGSGGAMAGSQIGSSLLR
jgi:hypothetical protein